MGKNISFRFIKLTFDYRAKIQTSDIYECHGAPTIVSYRLTKNVVVKIK